MALIEATSTATSPSWSCSTAFSSAGYCANCLKVQDKKTLRPVPLVLKPAQQRLARIMLSKLLAGEPIRVVVLKARRHGMSTLIKRSSSGAAQPGPTSTR